MIKIRLMTGAGLLILMSGAWAQVVVPQRGQTPEQIAKDQAECQALAQKQAAAMQQQSTPQEGQVLRGGARGAAAGAAIGAIAGNAGKGAAIGAVGGAMKGMFRRRDQQLQQQSAAANSQNAYSQAFANCMAGRGYSVQ
ncbi:hypothetical protein MIN45_P0947 [Methylomarinovum tepidoasis]|uniref:Glycine-zipper-containing OmpA-like membrane domain-containing protein n=1 Tax=Methylomarinovum tepidoasis TaxID=2840183 RepID=A0AAU9CQF3_9GAMM|nr:glycine zipper family protein [Methylomarinovum sp. IN45]BCX88578.1 hypothetical protein MIN45_P0947 [Methylomarinovum sp. IN45]